MKALRRHSQLSLEACRETHSNCLASPAFVFSLQCIRSQFAGSPGRSERTPTGLRPTVREGAGRRGGHGQREGPRPGFGDCAARPARLGSRDARRRQRWR